MADKEYKKYDSAAFISYSGARLTKNAEVREGDYGKMVRLSVVATSRKDNYSDLWIEVNVSDFNSEAAAYLEKGDVLHNIRGRIALRLFGDNNEKFSIVCDRADLVIPPELFATLKERGFTPGAGGKKPAPGGKKPAAKTNAKPAAKPVSKKPVPVEIPDDDDVEIEDDEESE